MGLAEHLVELKKELEEAEQREAAQTQDDPQPEPIKEPEPKPEEKPEPEPEKPAEPTPDPAPKTEPEPDGNAYQRIRREKAAAEKRAEAAEAELARERESKRAEVPLEELPAEAPIDPELEEVKQTLRMSKAEREFQSLEQKFRAKEPEYDAISAEYAVALAQSIRLQNPRMSGNEIVEKTKETLLMKAAKYARDGFDPIEEMFHEAKDLGFTGKSLKREEPKKEEVEEKEVQIKPDLAKVAENRARSTNMTAGRGMEEAQVTLRTAADYSPAEWMKVSPADKRRILAGG